MNIGPTVLLDALEHQRPQGRGLILITGLTHNLPDVGRQAPRRECHTNGREHPMSRSSVSRIQEYYRLTKCSEYETAAGSCHPLSLSQVLGFGQDTHPEVHEGDRILREALCTGAN